jgi:hypothetical protein
MEIIVQEPAATLDQEDICAVLELMAESAARIEELAAQEIFQFAMLLKADALAIRNFLMLSTLHA